MEASLTHYEVLGINPSATIEQIKQAYHSAVLKHHPDKAAGLGPPSDPSTDGQGQAASTDTFQLVQSAWEVLRDADRRAAYDSLLCLRELQTPMTYQDELDMGDMDAEDCDGGARLFTYPCRCGDVYALYEAELAGRSSMVVPCRSCSNHVLVRASVT
ncbi:hypothetical protein PLESTB_000925500 [Pleodorina starrii]|uniref:Diphthamide biosynthesis protein 4 n=1 Tax=Pleodorina starrii TaxID=330485 RepID=A0A9W6BMT0_9CHLO|nr:hypothetical protein PLESTB_000925500 [Pleodorina starrii]GLC68473.1 hypothetical protein PLESTF_000695300 [Pleodorina starrii]